MSEQYPSEADLNALSGTTDPEQQVAYPSIYESPYYTTFYKMLYRLLDVARRAGDLRVFKDGDLTFGVRAGRFFDSDSLIEFAGADGQALTDNATNSIYLAADGTLTVNTGGFPDPSAESHIRLATIATGSASSAGVGGQYAHADITDQRGSGLWALQHGYGATVPRDKLAAEALARYPVDLLARCRQADGTALPTTAAGGAFGISLGGWGTGTLKLISETAQNATATDTLAFTFALPPEYVADADVKLVVHAKDGSSGGAGNWTLDAEVYELSDAGANGGDLCATAAQSMSGAAFADYTFTITDTNLAAGDRLLVLVRGTAEETADSGTIHIEIGNIELQLDIKG